MRTPLPLLLFLASCAPEEPAPQVDGWTVAAQASIAAGEYAPRSAGDELRVTNRAQSLHARFGAEGMSVRPQSGGGEVRLALRAWGRDGALVTPETVAPEEGACLKGGATDAFGECLHRVDYARPGLTEWWENRPDGMEHGFTVTAAPDGEGPLVLDLLVEGAAVEIDADEARFVPEWGTAMRYAGLAAWDETGRSLAAWMEEGEDGPRLVVDDTGAFGTITVDPVLTTVAWSVEGNQSAAALGFSVASAGDVNGDGFGDVIVGAKGYNGGSASEGRAYVYHGSAAGLSTTADWYAESNQANAEFGYSVASAGDVNGDGYGDVIVGAPMYDSTQTDAGQAYVYLGSASGLDSTAAWTASSNSRSADFGFEVASAGDVNGDGYADVIVSADAYSNGSSSEGGAWVYHGSSSGLSTTSSWVVEGGQANAVLSRVSSAGDVNGDGYDDVIVGAPQYDDGQTDEGEVWLYLGSSTGLSRSSAWSAEGDMNRAYLGAVSAAGDVNGDGYADVIIGASNYTSGGGGGGTGGAAFVYFGTVTGLSLAADWTVTGQAGSLFGHWVHDAGDVNGDGYADVIVGAYAYDNGSRDEGAAFVYLGSATGPSAAADWTGEGGQNNAELGISCAGAGDVNGDGFGDLIVGADQYDNGSSNEGIARVYYGSSGGPRDQFDWDVEANQSSAQLGYAVSPAGDVNGDGFADVVVGAPYYDNGETDEGSAFLYLGTSSGLSSTAAWTGESNQATAYYGWSLGSGDFNGDGYADIVVGAPLYDDGETDEGEVFVYLGSSAGLSTTAAWSADSDQASAEYGHDVAGAGDTNQDGYDDVLASARYYDGTYTNQGKVDLYFGSASGPSTAADWTASGDQTSAVFGFSVASAGDVNGDGYADVIVGSIGYNHGSSDEGRAWVYEGSATGPSTTADWTEEPDVAQAFFGWSVASAGDVNGDGYGDVIISAAYYDDGETDEGAAFVYHGSSSGLTTSPDWSVESDQSSARMGTSVASAGDVNGDGYGDVVVGIYQYDDGSTDEGEVRVYFGTSSGLPSTDDWSIQPNQSNTLLGWAVAPAGDVNGDGYGDILVGANGYESGSTDEGQATVYFGNGQDNTGIGPARTPQARLVGTTTPVSPGLGLADATFDVSMATARGAWGRSRVALQVEAKPLGTVFDGTDLTTSSAYTDSTLSGVALQETVFDLVGETGYHWRARVAVDPAHGTPQAWGPWVYGGRSGDANGTHLVTGVGIVYADADGDGYGDAAVSTIGSIGSGYVSNALDCDDTDAAVSPGAAEVCDDADLDEDCDGLIDDDDPDATGQSTFYDDDDGDGYGNTHAASACDTPAGYSAHDGDCDDADPGIGPGNAELCDEFDNDEDCDGLADDADTDATGQSTFYADADGDGYGTSASTTSACDVPAGYAEVDGDCDDGNAVASPGGTEVCDVADVDEDCDGLVEDGDPSATGLIAWYVDADGDGYGDGAPVYQCEAPAGSVADGTDCDDGNAGISPGSVEACDAADVDEDCDGLADDADASVTGQTTYYADTDADGYGGTRTTLSCEGAPSGYFATSTDCNDADAAISPAATEACDASDTDEDCDGLADDADPSATGQTTFYADVDADGYGGPTAGAYCDLPSGYLATSTDCDDTDAAFHPGATEADCADPNDYNCDGAVGTVDGDADGYVACADCDDNDADFHPGASESDCTDPNDYNCDGSVAYADEDGDGFAACQECDDTNAATNPDADELVGDGVDEDCDGGERCYVDADGDAYRIADSFVVVSADIDCDDAGEATDATPDNDCNDADVAYHPGAEESDCTDPNDYNCDGSTGYADLDADGFAACTECDDATNAVNPDATEVCNDVDDDCDGTIDVDAVDATTWYADEDGDGYTEPGGMLIACDAPDGYGAASAEADCDDADALVHPGSDELPDDGIDQDCDGADLRGDTADPAGDDTGAPAADDKGDKGCGCATGSNAAAWLWAAGVVLAARRRRS